MNSNPDKFSDEQIADLLVSGAELPEDAELKSLKAALGSYRSETLLWAERRSAVQPSLVPAARRNRFWAAVPQWSLAAVALLTVATGIAHFTGDQGGDAATIAPTVAVTAPAPVRAVNTQQTDIAADNRLLSSIDQALSYRPDSPADEFGLKSSGSRSKLSTNPGAED